MMSLNEAKITDSIIENIIYWQEDDCDGLEEDIRALDDAITFIACGHQYPEMLSEKESISVIAALGFLKKRLRLFNGRERRNECK
ncbi:hypothetical protein [Parabacteroides sp. AM08-6]|uniref:hypothetical protein n=1 Tax=Parabacteroides sp. AM08-6 TaxID=2292053 RepID=UPI000EFDDE80|nr:hypothetical protein [Parabacteroides sp. AM08-6]RHJ83551.1 hypothetical protein DW103_07450 [Parabacteroides sp. AM08-6]